MFEVSLAVGSLFGRVILARSMTGRQREQTFELVCRCFRKHWE